MRDQALKFGVFLPFAMAVLVAGNAKGECFDPLVRHATAVDDTTILEVCSPLAPLAVVRPPLGFVAGCDQAFEVRPRGNSANAVYLDFRPCRFDVCCDQGGSAALECGLEKGVACNFGSNPRIFSGARRGALRDALTRRFESDNDQRPAICYRAYAEDSVGNGSRVMILPVTDDAGAGRGTVSVIGYAAFFLRGSPVDEDAVLLEYLRDVTPRP